MPIGSHSCFIRVNLCVLATNPQTILDLGIGYGMNGAGIRNWYSKDVHITGIEGFEKYRNPMWDLYTEVLIRDIRDFLQYCVAFEEFYDMVIMTDVLEHFTKEEGIEILKMIAFITKKAAVVSTPAIWFDQEAVNENELERHHCVWSVDEFKEQGWGIVQDGSPDYLGHQMIIADKIIR